MVKKYGEEQERLYRLIAKKENLKRQSKQSHRHHKDLNKRIVAIREEENFGWKHLHSSRRTAQRKGVWDQDLETVMFN